MGNIFKKLRDSMPARRKHIRELRDSLARVESKLACVVNEICDNNGLGRLELMLANAHVPVQHRHIFYRMFSATRGNVNIDSVSNLINDGGGGASLVLRIPQV
ncbi:hypothetical protein CQA66_01895 [Helicobacter aurati]|uniref:Uncharacterized protein n=1 Tax=Helicobacter aurati TaxID=137778 RepID=A0A3D8J7G2_9HELI|nr:hypothetical protein [Helicobacter aurati]RDU73437.1 hypothetical protein CQA66_01895 [Helicobacter aurati]